MVLQTEFAQIKNNNLYIDDVKATELAKKYGTPLYLSLIHISEPTRP